MSSPNEGDLILQQITDMLGLDPLEMVGLKKFYDWFVTPPTVNCSASTKTTETIRRRLGLKDKQ